MRTHWNQNTRISWLAGCLGAALLIVAFPVVADVEPGTWMLRFGGQAIESSSDLDFTEVDIDGDRTEVDTHSGSGFSFAAEYRFNDRYGLETALAWSANDVDVVVVNEDDLMLVGDDTLEPLTITLGPDFHLTPTWQGDLYLGAFAGYTFYNNLTFGSGNAIARVETDDEFTIGAVLGLDYPFANGRWNFCSSVRYMNLEIDPTVNGIASDSVNHDPMAVAVGFGYRF